MKHELTGNGGKGSAPRAVDKAKFDEGFDRIFGKKTANQCDGCNAGIYKDVQGMHRDADSNPVMVCQASKYGKQECEGCKREGMYPSHNGSSMCKSGSIASGGNKAHCTCDVCF